MQLPREASRRYRTVPGYGALWVRTSSDLANNTSYVHVPPLATSVSRITYFLAMFIRYCTSSAFEGSHASSLSCTQGARSDRKERFRTRCARRARHHAARSLLQQRKGGSGALPALGHKQFRIGPRWRPYGRPSRTQMRGVLVE
jgi:hypothetical protein